MNAPNDMLRRLCDAIAPLGRVVVAYSGGVDSAVVATAAMRACGQENVRVCLADSPSLPRRELRGALATAKAAGFAVQVVSTREIADPHYAKNPENRCFFCKSELYDVLLDLARREGGGFNAVLDGTNASDVGGHRPSLPAARARDIRSPLLEAGFSKDDVRALARALRLNVADKPASACLASRVPTGVPVTAELLSQIERAEDALAAAGLRQFRVRHHGEIARIEVDAEEFEAALARRREIVAGVRAAGYRFVTLDLAGYGAAADPVELTVAGQVHSRRNAAFAGAEVCRA